MEGLALLPFAQSQFLLPLPKVAAIPSPHNSNTNDNNTNGFLSLRPHRRRGFRFRASLFSKAHGVHLPQHHQQQQQQVTVNPNSVSGDSIRQRFLHFYASRGHKLLPSASLVPDDPTVLLTIAGMLQFKPIFLGKVPRQVPCAATAQRCIRTNDINNVGLTARHHTFFEMLGNFSFGDYFKKQAILWAWELSTSEFGLPPDRLWVSVYKDDDEAFQLWSNEVSYKLFSSTVILFTYVTNFCFDWRTFDKAHWIIVPIAYLISVQVGVPVERIKRLGEEDNFWTSGVTGPCGPCSEIYYDFHPERGYVDADLNDDTRFIEFYNLVFMQYNKKDDGSLEPLKQKNIDTGLGLERLARILQQVPNNYETDLIFPIIEKASKLANVSYGFADDQTKRNLKIIGDHMRAIVFLISDGVVPSNVGRGYVVRRLIRRVVRTGRLLGIKGDGRGDLEGAFSPIIAEKVVELSTQIDADVKNKAPRIFEELKREELRFVHTLERGEKLLEEKLSDALSNAERNGTVPCLAGEDVFLLYDTYGYPMEITKEVAEERGVSIDMDGFDIEMEKQRRQSQAAHNTVRLAIENGGNVAENVRDTEFIGYDRLHCKAMIESLMVNGNPAVQVSEGSNVEVLLNKTPFYAESGGQIGDHGFLYISEGDNQPKAVVEIIDVQKSLGNIFVHKGTVQKGVVEVGKEVEAAVDPKLRQRAKVHHTATHLLQAALKKVIGQETSQAGSLVAFDRLRFDFNFHRPLRDSELAEIELLINGWIEDATLLQNKVMPLADAKSAGAIAMFGEKYGEEVRVVEVPGVSMELCGGTHVNNTSEIRGFKIISEQGIASGIRRIEAVAGEAFIEYINARDFYLKQLCSTLKVKPEEVTTRIENLLEELRVVRNENSAVRAKAAIYKASGIASKALLVGNSKQYRVLVESFDDVDAESLKSAAEYLLETLTDPAAVILGSCPGEGKVSLVAAFSPGVVDQGIQAGKFIGQIAKLCGGGGGGRPNFAQAGGRKPENLSSALDKARSELMATLSEKGS
ncbi:alanine--tRNA ligase, chloroplastic/mitochondrial isoform X1 [Vigna angularis]|uniref:alanine--tRNA ligase, chloroplastic/mitochondrial isoform X1 n=1 Tax=Phaseolus angularis TaxID=3914 RepID=UPI000809CF39|nr:alanine--tRNA ligase, chloroplastic/mitochondrial isoform X1 [Vigna angularis]